MATEIERRRECKNQCRQIPDQMEGNERTEVVVVRLVHLLIIKIDVKM